eukprot:s1481_g9.t1
MGGVGGLASLARGVRDAEANFYAFRCLGPRCSRSCRCLQMSCCCGQVEPVDECAVQDLVTDVHVSTFAVGVRQEVEESIFHEAPGDESALLQVEDREHYNFEIEVCSGAGGTWGHGLLVHGSFFRLGTFRASSLTLLDAAVTSGKQHHEVSIDSTGAVQHVRPKHASRGQASQLIRKEAVDPSVQDKREHFDLLVLIPASGQRDQGRMRAIRKSWTKDIDEKHLCRRCHSNRTVKYLFMLGDEATEDDPPIEDVVVLPRCSSAYERLAQKVKRSIHYAVQHYSFNLLLKADTDSWIFLDRLLQFAEDHHLFDPRRSAQAGEVRRKGRPHGAGRNPDAVFTELTGQETYPVYSPGCGYLLTRNLCNYISLLASEDGSESSEASLLSLQDLPQEDVSVGFWLEAPFCNLKPEEMRRRWQNLQRTGDPCAEADDDDGWSIQLCCCCWRLLVLLRVRVWKMETDCFGLEFDTSNSQVPVIAHVTDGGQASKWNQRAEASRKLRPGLGLRSVNDLQDCTKLLNVLTETTGQLTIGFTSPSLETVTLRRKQRGESWGVRVVPSKAGLYVQYCEGIADRCGLQAGVHICSVNGRMETEKQMEEMEGAMTLTLRVASFAEPVLRVVTFV